MANVGVPESEPQKIFVRCPPKKALLMLCGSESEAK
jgi:hypothetical protein